MHLLRLNTIQGVLLNYIARCWHLEVRCWVLIPKARQGGVSTFWAAWFYALCVLHDRLGDVFRAATIAHIEDSAKAIFGISRRYEKRIDRSWQQPLDSRQQGRLEFENTGSFIQVNSVQVGDDLLKGFTLDAVHMSECANYAGRGANPDEAFTSTTNALGPGQHTFLVMESTARGRDPFFHRKIRDSVEGKNGIQTLFFPWFLTSEYTLTWEAYRKPKVAAGASVPLEFEPTEEEKKLRQDLLHTVVKPGEEWRRYQVDLTDEQLIWRRRQIEDFCGGKLEVFQRYFPSTLEECFTTMEHSMFSAETLDYYFNMSSEDYERGGVTLGTTRPTFSENRTGHLKVWEHPIPGEEYVIGADVSEGLQGRDFSSAYVVHKPTLKVCAHLHGTIAPDQFAKHLYALGLYYEKARLAPENNYTPTTAVWLMRQGYPNLHYYHSMDSAKRGVPSKPGWNTNKKTREILIDCVAQVFRDREVKVFDYKLVEEMSSFVWWPDRKRFAAATGRHDDRVMSLGIALVLCTEGRRRVEQAQEAEGPHDPSLEGYRAFMREQRWLEAMERRQADKPKRKVLVL